MDREPAENQEGGDWAVVDSRRPTNEATAMLASSFFPGGNRTPLGAGDNITPPEGKLIWRKFEVTRQSAVYWLGEYFEHLNEVVVEEPTSTSSVATSRDSPPPVPSNRRAMDLKVCADAAIRDLFLMQDIIIHVLQNIAQSRPSLSPVAIGWYDSFLPRLFAPSPQPTDSHATEPRTATFSASAILVPAKYTAALALSSAGALVAGATAAVPWASYE
ncbi:hypothetical protein QBC35DRAFT_455385 [Podospora australis]|uniref:Uncharacterized protein n=1 Tax=Podospora australis TaxID=1536484 RepID=A0AAN7ADA3_9PEZI|nr:hypothetical protein QBC35DRAFT_455385 [Podospora australis]